MERKGECPWARAPRTAATALPPAALQVGMRPPRPEAQRSQQARQPGNPTLERAELLGGWVSKRGWRGVAPGRLKCSSMPALSLSDSASGCNCLEETRSDGAILAWHVSSSCHQIHFTRSERCMSCPRRPWSARAWCSVPTPQALDLLRLWCSSHVLSMAHC